MRDVAGADGKAEARGRARATRRAMPLPDAGALAQRALDLLTSLDGPPRTTCYVSYGMEPPTGPTVELLEAAGFDVLLPRVVGADLEWVESRGPRETSAMGIDEPMGPAVPLLPLRAMLIPALAVTTGGERLGKGGGFYDRVLASLPDGVPVIAMVGDHDVVASVPVEAHDRPVDAVITPTRTLWVRPR